MTKSAPPDPSSDDILTKLIENAKHLGSSAIELQSVGSQLAKPIGRIDTQFRVLNLGVEAWANTEGGWEEANGDYERHMVGYARVGGEWCLAIRVTKGNDNADWHEEVGRWAFNDAPYPLRVDAVEALPKLVGRLTKKVQSITGKVTERIPRANEFASAIVTALKQK